MANSKSAKKRIRTNEKSRQRNKAVKTNLKTTEKKLNAALALGDEEQAEAALRLASRKFDKAASKGVIHKNAANRKKAQFARRFNRMNASADV
ncbi:MAG: 30S ribosomal protein S20 [Eubacteriaceae bacterium]|nr:30S ribosomal protein S20 [Eubacteriaceae bacterium]